MVTLQSVQGHTDLTHRLQIFDTWALWHSGLSARVPKCQKIKTGGLDRYGPEHFERQFSPEYKKCGTERVKRYW